MRHRFFQALLLPLLLGTSAFAAKNYQVTGPVLEVTPSKIVLQKGKDRWEITRDSSTKIEGTPVVGSTVTVYYSMLATDVEVKGNKK